MSKTLLTTLVLLPIAISIIIMLMFRGKGPSVLEQESNTEE